MFRNYLTIAIRHLVKNKTFSLINIFGLATGIGCCILISLFIQDEFNYEKGIPKRDKIYRLNTTFLSEGNVQQSATTSPSIAPGLSETIPEIENYTRVLKHPGVELHIIRYQEDSFFESDALLVDSTFLELFPFELKEGDPETALDRPSTILISEELSEKIFGDNSALNEMLIVNSGTSADTFQITGVVAPQKFPSHLDADMYMTMSSNGWGDWVLSQTTWANNNMVNAYVLLRDPAQASIVENKIPDILDMHAGEELRNSGRGKIINLQPLDEIRLFSDSTGSNASSGITNIYILATIAGLILLLGCINFMNLTTAKSTQRAGEVGIRKSMGAYRSNLIRQFLGESAIIVLIALIIAFGAISMVLPYFNNVIQKELTLNAANLSFIIPAAIAIGIFTALLAGTYPAFFLSSMKPTVILKGKALSSDGSHWLRKGLVVAQFVITITLISSIIIINRQLNFIQSKSLGFNAGQVVMIPLRTLQASQQYLPLKQSFERLSGVNQVSATNSLPSTPLFSDWMLYKEGSTKDQTIQHEVVRVDKDYFDVLGVEFLAGRDFIVEQDNLSGDTINHPRIIVNETSLRAYDIPLEKAVGTNLYFESGSTRYAFTIIGVVKDFHQFSLHEQIVPMVFFLPSNRGYFTYMAASVDLSSYAGLKKEMKQLWDQNINNAPFESVFLYDNVQNLYAAEERTSALLTISTIIALVISCLGLYSLSVFIAERKTKEIGIRKVMGASVEKIIGMLSKEYVRLILIAFVISVPIGYYFMSRWLENFAYKIAPGFTIFLLSGIISFLIAWFTISFESFRAANKNPVDVLRNN